MNNITYSKFGKVRINNSGYYTISSREEGNHGKLLHRLIYEDFWGVKLIPQVLIHHKNGNKLDNCILNLEAMLDSEHKSLHHKGKTMSESAKEKMKKSAVGKYRGENNPMYNKIHLIESRLEMSKKHNSTGYYGVSKIKHKSYKQGFCWEYSIIKDGKPVRLFSTTLDGLKEKVLDNDLVWRKLNG